VTDEPSPPGYWKDDSRRKLHTVVRNDQYTLEPGQRSRLEIPVGKELIVIIAIVFVTMSSERLVRGPKPTNRDSPAVQSRNNQYERTRGLRRQKI